MALNKATKLIRVVFFTLLFGIFGYFFVTSSIKLSEKRTGSKQYIEETRWPKFFPSMAINICPMYYNEDNVKVISLLGMQYTAEDVKNIPRIQDAISVSLMSFKPFSMEE